MSPQRIQQRRTKGWRKPEGAVAVGRGTKWGNPVTAGLLVPSQPDPVFQRFWLKQHFRRWLGGSAPWLGTPPSTEQIQTELAGKDLMCWCPLDQPCHADVLLKIANQEESA